MSTYGEATIGELLNDRKVRLEVANLLVVTEGDLLLHIGHHDEDRRLEDLYRPIPADLARTSVVEARGNEDMIERIARHTGLSVTEVSGELERTHGRTLLPKVFDFIWPARAMPASISDAVKSPQTRPVAVPGGKTVRNNLFVSYSQVDRFYVERLLVHLRPLERQGLIDVWDDSKIRTGHDWQAEIGEALANAGAAVLMVSADFAASSFIAENELPALLESNRQKGLKLFPVIVGHISVSMHRAGVLRFQAINRPERPLSSLQEHEREKLLADLATRIYSALKS